MLFLPLSFINNPFMTRIVFLSILLALSMKAAAQSESRDSLLVAPPPAIAGPDSLLGPSGPSAEAPSPLPPIIPDISGTYLQIPFATRYELERCLGALGRPGVIARWNGGAFGASRTVEWLPGLMAVESGSFSVGQTLGPVTFRAFASATHYGTMMGMTRTLGFGGSLTYTFSPRVSMTLYGAWHTSPAFATAAMAGYMEVPSFGGFVDYRFADHWGVKAGFQSYRSMLDNHWHTQPSLTPYYRTSSGAEIGVDVGSIIYNLINDAANRAAGKSWGPQNPTIAPPRIGVLPVGEAPPPPPGAR